MIILVACVDINNGLGDKNGNLLFNLPKDMAHFKSITTGKHVVMGRKTWDSLPIKPLPKRKNYVLTNDESLKIEGNTKIINSVDDILEMSKSKDVYIIGGGEVYYQLMPYAEKLILTHVHTIDMNARTFFPDVDVRQWKITSVQPNDIDENHEFSFTFATYDRKATQSEIQKMEEELNKEENTEVE